MSSLEIYYKMDITFQKDFFPGRAQKFPKEGAVEWHNFVCDNYIFTETMAHKSIQ